MKDELPSPAQYLDGARRAAANARMLWRASRLLGRAGFYGPATTLLATALEEAAKGGVLVLLAEDSSGTTVEHGRLLALVFRDHRTKFRLAQWAIGFKPPPEAAELPAPQQGEAGLGLLLIVALFLLASILRREPTPHREPEPGDTLAFLEGLAREDPEVSEGWIATAFERRNAGLYVALRGNTWHSPADIDAEDLREGREAVLPFILNVSRWARSGTSQLEV